MESSGPCGFADWQFSAIPRYRNAAAGLLKSRNSGMRQQQAMRKRGVCGYQN